MSRHHFAVTRTSEAPPERVFALLAAEAPDLPGWGEHEVIEHDPPRRHAYRLSGGLSVRDYLAVVDLTPTEEGGTRIDWQAQFHPVVPGTGALIEAVSRRAVTSTAESLARAAEQS